MNQHLFLHFFQQQNPSRTMSQQRITLFFPYISRKKISPDTKCHFLELPATIRLRIYREAGLLSDRTIHLNYWSSRKKENLPRIGYDARDDTRLPALPLSLFAVCRSVHDELRKVLYGENRLIISSKAPRGLRALERLSDATLQEIRFLVIRANVSSCERMCCGGRTYRCGNSWYECSDSSSHDTPLSSNANQLVISQWQRICTKLASSIQPGKLALYVICDCADRTTAQMITESLLLLPVLRECGLRLAVHSDEDIKIMAKDTAMYLTGSPPPPAPPPFRFLDLPKEIQLHILGYASIVPVAEIICTQKQLRYWTFCRTRGVIADATYVANTSLMQCFCSAAHSAFNFRCPCPKLPSPFAMFLVSRKFKDCAMEVFYGQNSFCVAMQRLASLPQNSTIPSSRVDTEDEDETVESLSEISIVPGLSPFPHPSISHLTSLNLLFEFSNLRYLQPDRPGWHSWLRTIDTLSREANLEALTIQLRMNETMYPDFDDEKPTFDLEYESFMLQTYENLLQPMKALHGLKNFFIHLNWATSSGFPDGRQEIEQVLERMVMGQKYDAWKRGKTIRHEGRWRELAGVESV